MRNNHEAMTLGLPEGEIAVSVLCPACSKMHTLTVPVAGYMLWLIGEPVQVAFPDIAREDREMLVTGTCSSCWLEMYGPPPAGEPETQFVIPSEIHTDDHVVQVQFDALPFFQKADDGQIAELASIDWRGDYAADRVALEIAGSEASVAHLFEYLRVLNENNTGNDMVGFEVSIDGPGALAWLQENRPATVYALPRTLAECTCPTECDCASPDTEPALCSNSCPIHNHNPSPDPECPIHGRAGNPSIIQP